jgi:hypothetical protein
MLSADCARTHARTHTRYICRCDRTKGAPVYIELDNGQYDALPQEEGKERFGNFDEVPSLKATFDENIFSMQHRRLWHIIIPLRFVPIYKYSCLWITFKIYGGIRHF